MRHGLGRTLIVLAVFALAFLIFGSFMADRNSKAGLIGLIRSFGDTPGGKDTVKSEEFTLASPSPKGGPLSLLEQIDQATNALVEQVMPSVVRIDTRKIETPLSGLPMNHNEDGLGSGVIISEEGHVITNYHVVYGVDEITVSTTDRADHLATLIGFDADMDIALLKIENPDKLKFQPLPFGKAEELKVGHMIMAIGSPMGLTNSVTTGIVSGRYRQESDTAISMLMTTAIINPGSSGGPLINTRGELVGINTALYDVDGSKKSSWQGIGLATPADEALYVFYKIRQTGHQTGYIGVSATDLPAAPITQFGAEPQTAVMITEVKKDSPAEEAMALPGDVILSFAGRKIESTNELFPLVREHAVGESAPLVVFRSGEKKTLEVVIASLEDVRNQRALGTMDRVGRVSGIQDFCEAMGMEVGNFTQQMRLALGIRPDSPGIIVKQVEKGSQLAGKLQERDVIERLNDSFIYGTGDFHEKVNAIKPDVPLTIWFKRNGEDKSVTIKRVE